MNRKAYIVGRRNNLHSSISSDESAEEGALNKYRKVWIPLNRR